MVRHKKSKLRSNDWYEDNCKMNINKINRFIKKMDKKINKLIKKKVIKKRVINKE